MRCWCQSCLRESLGMTEELLATQQRTGAEPVLVSAVVSEVLLARVMAKLNRTVLPKKWQAEHGRHAGQRAFIKVFAHVADQLLEVRTVAPQYYWRQVASVRQNVARAFIGVLTYESNIEVSYHTPGGQIVVSHEGDEYNMGTQIEAIGCQLYDFLAIRDADNRECRSLDFASAAHQRKVVAKVDKIWERVVDQW